MVTISGKLASSAVKRTWLCRGDPDPPSEERFEVAEAYIISSDTLGIGVLGVIGRGWLR